MLILAYIQVWRALNIANNQFDPTKPEGMCRCIFEKHVDGHPAPPGMDDSSPADPTKRTHQLVDLFLFFFSWGGGGTRKKSGVSFWAFLHESTPGPQKLVSVPLGFSLHHSKHGHPNQKANVHRSVRFSRRTAPPRLHPDPALVQCAAATACLLRVGLGVKLIGCLCVCVCFCLMDCVFLMDGVLLDGLHWQIRELKVRSTLLTESKDTVGKEMALCWQL